MWDSVTSDFLSRSSLVVSTPLLGSTSIIIASRSCAGVAIRHWRSAQRNSPHQTQLTFSTDLQDIARCNVYIVTVPTPIDAYKRPDMAALRSASKSIGEVIKRGDVVVYESTVYPGATEEVCLPIIEKTSGLRLNVDFFAGYSPERINPGDKLHRLTTITKVTSGSTPEAADLIDRLYGSIVTAGTHRASSIRVAEAAKVIENTQRDLNIALINELTLIFERMDIDTEEVLQAAGTKWNFQPISVRDWSVVIASASTLTT